MSEEVVYGYSLEEIRQEWTSKLKLQPQDITLEVLEKPKLLRRKWKVRLSWNEEVNEIIQTSVDPVLPPSQVIWDQDHYKFILGDGVNRIAPFPRAGEVWVNGMLKDNPFSIDLGDQVEFKPLVQAGKLTWELEVLHQGLSVVAKVRHELPGHYTLPEVIPGSELIDLKQFACWESLPAQNNEWDEVKLNNDLEQLNVINGRRPESWAEILSVEGLREVVVAEASLPVPSQNAQLEDFVGEPKESSVSEENKIDFFASKVKLVEEGTVLARKIPGKPGVPGKDVFGRELGTASVKDFQFRLKKNVQLSEDGLEIIASCAGQPIRVDEKTYMVENVYVLHSDVDLANGSIEFPGDVYIQGNVQDGLHVFAGGRIEIKGSVSHAEIRAEKGAKIYESILGGKAFIGENFVTRSELLRLMSEFRGQLNSCLSNTMALLKSPGANSLKPGQCLKLLLEKQFSDLPKLSARAEKFILAHKDDEIVSEGLIVLIQTAKRYLAGLGPLDIQALPALQKVDQALDQFIENMTVEIPEKLILEVGYLQGASIECGGSFKCYKGTYNSDIHVEEDVTIDGVCRGGKIFGGGKIKINELGGSGVSSTFVQTSPDSRLSVNFCHHNVVIALGKEAVHIDEDCNQLEVYREDGRVQVEKLKKNPLNR
jgi:uncharacterized protein